MEIIERQAEYLGRKKITKLKDLGEGAIRALIEKDEGTVYVAGTEVNAELLKKVNWRDDPSVSFATRTDNNLPAAKIGETQIVTKVNGETWIVPPSGGGNAFIGEGVISKNIYSANTVSGNYLGNSKSYIRFKSGLCIQWGNISGSVSNGSGNGNADTTGGAITFPIVFSNSATPSVTLTGYWESGSREVMTRSVSATGFTAYANGAVRSFSWIAIGYTG